MEFVSILGGYFSSITLCFAFGWLSYWFFRKFTAKLQSRIGPPWYQPIADVIKLMGKEFFVPGLANRLVYIVAPFVGLSVIMVLSFIIPPGVADWIGSYSWDLLVILYLSVLSSIVLVIAGAASASTWGKIGASRETAMILSVELPLIISLLVPSIALRGTTFPSLSLNDIIKNQITGSFFGLPNWFIFRYPLAAIAMLACITTKIGVKPFGDIPEAEQEIIAGPLTEYGGPLLGIFEITKIMKFYVFSALFVDLYLGGGDLFPFPLNVISFLIKCFVIIVVITILDTISARYRITDLPKWYLSACLVLALVDLIRASLGGM
ncbi:MAG: hypothetical protein DRJ31_06955 [Candidatus Methanomethylicota archaeon]|uniref:NADH-quinone oxidoreductase subunit H n=1 Tax=Thermoproteota archaeon TaxID=2056631 RepID=A0A497ENP3_9CREN|nr:MAG: hypothetical protein DRJ31_06955 [Candidatus Verstraetearchaeota archaeon]